MCSRVKQCDPVLFEDADIDPIFNALVQQLDLKEYPDVISRTQDAKNAYYSFAWPGRFFLATVDLQTGSFFIVENTPPRAGSVQA